MPDIKLYSYYRSSSSYRVRIALSLKELEYQYVPVHLIKEGGEQHKPEYRSLNPSGEVPTLVVDGHVLTQSMAMIQFLDETFPEPRLIPGTPSERSLIIRACEVINSGIQPLQNVGVLQDLTRRFQANQETKDDWVRNWIQRGFQSLEKIISPSAGRFSFGDNVSAADLFLVPQVYNAQRFSVNMDEFPKISEINQNCLQLPPFKAAHPSKQPDAPKD